jgi:ribonuclease PH
VKRHDGRQPHELRPIEIQRGYTTTSPGSVLIRAGGTLVLCTASVDASVPSWKDSLAAPSGWVTAEYNMLPGSTSPRKQRKVDGRATEIQRLIGRSLRAVVDLRALGAHTITVDCDVLQADGGTRTLSITGGFIALCDAVRSISTLASWRSVFLDSVAAISVGVLEASPVADLDYPEDSQAEVDMNVVMTGSGRFVEIQGTAERGTFADDDLQNLLVLARRAARELAQMQRECLGPDWPLDTQTPL